MDNITTLTVNFKTPDLLEDCLTSFRKRYPGIPYIVVDNGGCQQSVELLRKMQETDRALTVIWNNKNAGHGMALNQGINLVTTRFVFLLDSDTRCNKAGFLEKMLELFDKDPLLFAAGWLRYVNDSGVAYRNGSEPKNAIKYVHPYACLMNRWKLWLLPKFTDGGAPAINMMRAAVQMKYNVESFPVEDYVWHKIAGTRGMFGGRINPKTDEEPGKWHWRSI
jgi:glycosyltransferase involved in cell wall biosynthesis